MGRALSSRLHVGLVAAALVAAPAGAAVAQNGPPTGALAPGGQPNAGQAARSGPGPKIAPKFGGMITGRMNLIAPQETGSYTPEPLAAPPPPPPPMFAPERIDRLDPAIVDQLKLPGLAPARREAAPAPAAVDQKRPTIEAALPSPAVTAPALKQPVRLSATFGEGGASVRSGVKWRLFTDQADANGEHMLVAESSDAAPRFEVDPGSYIVHAVYGLVSTAKLVTVRAGEPANPNIVLSAGAVRLTAFVGSAPALPNAVKFKLTRDEGGVARTVAENVAPGALLRLPAGKYHVTSAYGDANAAVEADIKVEPGKLVEAQVHHKAARVSLRLVGQPGGQELTETSWTIMTPGGDVIRESIGALPDVVLAEGDYVAIARRDGRLFQQTFAVKTGADARIEIVAR